MIDPFTQKYGKWGALQVQEAVQYRRGGIQAPKKKRCRPGDEYPGDSPGPSKKEFKSLKISAPGKSRGIWNGIGKSLINMDIFCC